MFVSAVFPPSAVDPALLGSDSYKEHVELFFKGIFQNGFLLVDSDGSLRNMLAKRAYENRIALGKHLCIYLEEVIKEQKKWCVLWPLKSGASDESEILKVVTTQCRPDALISAKGTISFDGELPEGTELVAISDYIHSEYEKKRLDYLQGPEPLDGLGEEEREQIIGDTVRCAKWLKFYDKQIGKASGNLSLFTEGIKYILNIWQREGIFAAALGQRATVDIYTGGAEVLYPDDLPKEKREKLEVNSRVEKILESNLMQPLRTLFPWKFTLFVKNDSEGIFHARHLRAQRAIVKFDPGFDLFTRKGGFRRLILKCDSAAEKHLLEIERLPSGL